MSGLRIADNYLKVNAYAQSCENMFTDVSVPEEFIIDITSLIGFCSFNKLFYTTGSNIQTINITHNWQHFKNQRFQLVVMSPFGDRNYKR